MIQFPQHKNKHTSQARGDEARKAQGGGERNLHLVFRGRWTIARGPSHTPFGGVRNLANTYRRCGANWAPPHIQLILTQGREGRSKLIRAGPLSHAPGTGSSSSDLPSLWSKVTHTAPPHA
eukprot:scaffold12640_cov106-Isochrysis_galbana.AAC.12